MSKMKAIASMLGMMALSELSYPSSQSGHNFPRMEYRHRGGGYTYKNGRVYEKRKAKSRVRNRIARKSRQINRKS